jgi:glycerol-3-phosphate O-acyltransferase
MVDHAITMDKFLVERDVLGEIISLDREQSILMTYYRNNIIHLFALPSLIAHIVVQQQCLTRTDIHQQVELLYPFLKAELFLRFDKQQLPQEIDRLIAELVRQRLLLINDETIAINNARIGPLQLLARTITETLQRSNGSSRAISRLVNLINFIRSEIDYSSGNAPR